MISEKMFKAIISFLLFFTLQPIVRKIVNNMLKKYLMIYPFAFIFLSYITIDPVVATFKQYLLGNGKPGYVYPI